MPGCPDRFDSPVWSVSWMYESISAVKYTDPRRAANVLNVAAWEGEGSYAAIPAGIEQEHNPEMADVDACMHHDNRICDTAKGAPFGFWAARDNAVRHANDIALGCGEDVNSANRWGEYFHVLYMYAFSACVHHVTGQARDVDWEIARGSHISAATSDQCIDPTSAMGTPGVYVLHDPSSNTRKIGMSINVGQRVNAIAASMPVRCQLERVFAHDDPRKLESVLHGEFAESRVNGEWFALQSAGAIDAAVNSWMSA